MSTDSNENNPSTTRPEDSSSAENLQTANQTAAENNDASNKDNQTANTQKSTAPAPDATKGKKRKADELKDVLTGQGKKPEKKPKKEGGGPNAHVKAMDEGAQQFESAAEEIVYLTKNPAFTKLFKDVLKELVATVAGSSKNPDNKSNNPNPKNANTGTKNTAPALALSPPVTPGVMEIEMVELPKQDNSTEEDDQENQDEAIVTVKPVTKPEPVLEAVPNSKTSKNRPLHPVESHPLEPLSGATNNQEDSNETRRNPGNN